MAKGSPFTTFTGKLGQIVGYIIKNAASKQSQGMRAYQPNVANPKTVLQANQRLCLKPLNNFARAMAPVIERGFENVKYGTDSRREFMRINMSNFNGPYLRKGNDDAVPGPFVISKGSLVPIAVLSDAGGFAVSDLYLGPTGTSGLTTVGILSQGLIAANTDVQDGDQLTFITAWMASGQYVYRVFSLTVDSNSTVALAGYPEGSTSNRQLDNFIFSSSGGAMKFSVGLDLGSDEVMVGAAVIQSREGSKGEHLRSDATFYVTNGVYDVWMSQEQYEAALSSYMGDAAVVDWPVQMTAESAVILQESISVHVPVTALNSSTADHFPNGVDCLGFVMSDGTVGVWVDTSAMYLLGMNGTRISWTVSDETTYAGLMSTDSFPWKYYFGGVVSE